MAILMVAAGLAASIAVLSLLPAEARSMTAIPPALYPIGHFACYALFAGCCVLVLRPALESAPTLWLAGCLIPTAFGALMEYLQKFRPGRSASLTDILIDAAGAALGSLAVVFWLYRGS